MKKAALPIFALLLFIFNAYKSEDEENITLNTIEATELKNLSYGADPQQVHDIYLAKNRSLNTGVMLLIHVGG